MNITRNDPLIARLARELVVRHVDLIARILHNNAAVPFDVFDLSAEADGVLFDLCFFGLVSLEEQSGFDDSGTRYLPQPAFHTNSRTDYVVGAASFHALVGDDTMTEGLERARATLASLRG